VSLSSLWLSNLIVHVDRDRRFAVKKVRKNEVRNYYMAFIQEKGTALRIEAARLFLYAQGDLRCRNWSRWCRLIHIPLSQYVEIVQNDKPIPMVVWPALYDLGFDLNWFASGQPRPLRSADISTVPVPMTIHLNKKDLIRQAAMKELVSFFPGAC